MKFYCKLPGGGEIRFKKEPMSQERFNMLVYTVWIYLIGSGVLRFFELAARR